MAEVIKTLAQVAPLSTTATDAYIVPVSTSTVISTITVCNQGASAGAFRISVAKAGAELDVKQYIYFDQHIGGKATYAITLGITLAASDVIRVFASSASMSFNIFGSEIT